MLQHKDGLFDGARYGALNGGNGDGTAAVLGGVALIDLFGSLRRPNLLPTRPGPQNPSPALGTRHPSDCLFPFFALPPSHLPCQRPRMNILPAHARPLPIKVSILLVFLSRATHLSPSIICQPTMVVLFPPPITPRVRPPSPTCVDIIALSYPET
ncbi:hypothetical protein BD309DRAFT_46041 [Dichomitus squalens]|nr:hypothetical protein BD309DRAFT_46041 [Dichomitus squalens]